ncbi:MAG: YfcC family protein [Neisseria sp.]|nr:YfcC family protein [Neisseria sp.]
MSSEKPTPNNETAPKALSKAAFNPALMMLAIAFAALVLTYVLPSGEYRRQGKMVVPGTYRVLEKDFSLPGLLTAGGEKAEAARAAADTAAPAGIFDFFVAVPEGIIKDSALVIMVLFVGGMFGILNRSGAVQAALERVLALTRHNVRILIPVLMLVFAAGTTFLGFSKEYLLMIPLTVALANRMGLPNIIGLAVVALGNMVGHMASITNPYVLTIAQPMLGLPIFSGMWLRVLTFVLMLSAAVVFVLWRIRGMETASPAVPPQTARLSLRQSVMLSVLGLGVAFMVYASHSLHWKAPQLAGYYLFLSMLIGAVSGLGANEAADAFIGGVKKMVVAALLIGLAVAVELILAQGKVLDTIIYYLVEAVGTHGPYVSAYAVFASELMLDVVIPSAVGKAAVSMPILGPIGELSGLSPQTTVFAFLMGNGLSNMFVPTSAALLIFLSAAEVGWTKWVKFVWPLVAVFLLMIIVLLAWAVSMGY